MPSSEDYTLIWVGVSVKPKPTELSQALEGKHWLFRSARKAGLDSWCDSFDPVPGEDANYRILIGKRLATLGYKEGKTTYRISSKKLEQTLAKTRRRLSRLKRRATAKLYVLVHVEDVD
jgi:hypothetical protein